MNAPPATDDKDAAARASPSGSAPRTRTAFVRVADLCALVTAAVALVVLAGWAFDIDRLRRVLPGLVAMKFNTAAGFLLAGLALWRRRQAPLRLTLGALVGLVGALSLVEQLAGLDLGIDQLVVRDVVAAPEAGFPPGRMAPSTALCFVLFGVALLGIGEARRRPGPGPPAPSAARRWSAHLAELFALTATTIGGFALVAYPTGALYLRQLPGFVSMALHTAAAFVALGIGILCAGEGAIVQTLRFRGTGRLLWAGFGLVTCLLAAVGIVFTASLHAITTDIDAQANVARPRMEEALELEATLLGHGLAVSGARPPQEALEHARRLDGHLAEYRALAITDRQRQLATRFAARWQEARRLGVALVGAGEKPGPDDLARFVALRQELQKLLQEEIRPEAIATFEARKAATLRRLQTSGDVPLLLLVAGVVLALVTSGAVARAVSRQEQVIHDQREWLRVTLSSIGDGVIACDTDRRITFLNPVAGELTGWRPEEALGQPITAVLRLMNERTREPAADVIEQALREGRVVAMANHTALVTRDGREVSVEDSAAPITDAIGGVKGAVLVFHDVTQRRRAVEQLEESRARLGRAQEMAHLGSWELDLVGKTLTWSDEVYRIFGLEPQQFGATYEAFLEAVHPDDRAAVDAAYSGSVREGLSSYEIEHRVVRKSSGEVRIVHEKCVHLRAGDQIVRSLGMVHDITERKRAEEALRRSREWLRVTLTSIGDAVIACDTAGRVTFVNAVAAALTGWSAEEALDQPVQRVFQIVDEETRAPAEDIVARVLRDRRVVALANHTSLLARDGRAIPIADSAAPILDDDGAVGGVVIVFHDVSAALQARKEREATLDLLRLVNRSSGTSDLIESATEFFRRQSGCEAVSIRLRAGDDDPCLDPRGLSEELRGRVDPEEPCFTEGGSFWANDMSRLLATITDADADGQGRTPNRCGGEGYESVALVPLLMGGERLGLLRLEDRRRGMFTPERIALWEQLAGYLAAAVARSQAAEALHELKDRLEEADRRKNEFLAVLSHELRNPLAPIRNSLYVLERAVPGGAQATRAKAVIDRQVGHLSHLVDDLLDLTRVSRNKIQLQRRRIDLCEVVRRSVEDQRSLFEHGGVALAADIPGEPLFIEADANRVAQVVGNLLQNAAKFTERGGGTQVSVALDGQRERAVVRVSDTGVGMTPETLAGLFQPFVQADKTLDRSKGGLGLGLALVKGLVELHGGEVTAHSAGLGKGAELVVALPLDGVAEAPAPAVPSSVRRCSLRVLVIEDNVDAAESLRDALELGGHEVAVAYDGPDGIARARASRPDVVLCDIGLPGMDGYEIARAFRADPSLAATHLVALSGYALPEDLQRAAEAGFRGHLAKPPSIQKLEELLGRVRPRDA